MLHNACSREGSTGLLILVWLPRGQHKLLRHRHWKQAAQGSSVAAMQHPRVHAETLGFCVGKVMFQEANPHYILF